MLEASTEPVPIIITHGYWRDHRPELKQFTLRLINCGDGDVPLWLQVGNGNDADKAFFTETIMPASRNAGWSSKVSPVNGRTSHRCIP